MTLNNRILIAEDESDIAAILKLYLEDNGYATAWANDGEVALSMLGEGNYAVALLDIKMPRLDGIEVLEQIRKSGSDVAVLMMTAHGNENLAVACMKSGAVDYFPKPFDLDDVLRRVERAMAYRNTLLEKKRLELEKADFVSMLSHDMKNPITAVIGSIDIMREGRLGPVNEEQAEYLQAAIESCNEVVSMIDNLLDIHRFEAGRMRMPLRVCNPAEIIPDAAGRFIKIAAQEEINMEIELAGDLPDILADRNAIIRIVGNLLGNAIKFTPVGGQITVKCLAISGRDLESMPMPDYVVIAQKLSACRKLLRLSVKDTGSGILSEDQERIFERFVQSRKNGEELVGTGLGLAYCKMAVENLGGLIWVESEPGRGSEFIILIPGHDSMDSA